MAGNQSNSRLALLRAKADTLAAKEKSASRAAVELEHRLALRVTILGEAERAAVLQDHALFGGVADSLCHFLRRSGIGWNYLIML